MTANNSIVRKLRYIRARRRRGILARRTRFLNTSGMYPKPGTAPRKGVEDSSHPGRGADVDRLLFPGVRKKRVPLAKFLAPLRGALCPKNNITVLSTRFCSNRTFL